MIELVYGLKTRCIEAYMRRHGILIWRQCFEPEIRIVASVSDEGIIVCADHLGVPERLESFAVEVAESRELGCADEGGDVVDCHIEC